MRTEQLESGVRVAVDYEDLDYSVLAHRRCPAESRNSWSGSSMPVAVHYGARRLAGQTHFRAVVSKPRPAGTVALPGDAARLRFYNDPESGACMIHDPTLGTLAAVMEVTHPAYLLLSAAP
jgi:hypothetical protein